MHKVLEWGMPKLITPAPYMVYEYDELSDQAKVKARDWFIGTLQEMGYDDMWVDMFDSHLTEYGFPGFKFSWNVSYSQGDFVSFSGRINFNALAATASSENVDVRDSDNLMKVRTLIKKGKDLGIEFEGTIEDEGRSWQHPVPDVTFGWLDEPQEDETAQHNILNEMERTLKRLAEELASDCYKLADNDVDWQNSEESVAENIRSNEYTFLEDGTRAN